MSNTTNRKSKNALLLISGAIAGAAATYYLHTPKGKKMTRDVMEKGNEIKNTMAETAQTISRELKDKTNAALELANEKLVSAQELLNNQVDEVIDQKNEKISTFQNGVEKAKKAIVNADLTS